MSVGAYSRGGSVEPIHTAVPGRLRARVRGLKHNPETKQRLELALLGRPEVRSVRASTRTGTVLVEFDAAVVPEDMLARLSRASANDNLSSGEEPAAERQPWHTLDAVAVAEGFGVLADRGLTAGQVARLTARFGSNVLPEPKRLSRLAILLSQFNSMPVALLLGSAVLSLMTGGLVDALIIAGVVGINAAIGFFTENQAERTIASLDGDDRCQALVRRDGRLQTLPAAELVPGDLLLLMPGMSVPADSLLLEARNLSLDESVLTGESRAVFKAPGALADPKQPLAERRNMVYRGTLVTAGSGLAVVVATGSATEIGLVQKLVGDVVHPPTPMQTQLDRLGRQLVLLSTGICAAVFGIGLLRGYGLLQMLKTATALAVAAVPEGLPMVATSTLALGIRHMRRHGVLVRRLDAVETMGAVGVICFDKTGTLTLNSMVVGAVHAGGRAFAVADNAIVGGIEPHGELRRLMEVVVLCSDAVPRGEDVDGSATETALLRLAMAGGVAVEELRRRRPRLSERYRDERRQSMATRHSVEGGGRLIAVKGNPVEVLELCSHWMRGGIVEPLDAATRRAIMVENERLAGEGLRVLGFAMGETADGADAEESGLTWLGLVGLSDPLRQGMRGVVRRFQQSGIATVMITGDQKPTAAAIARALDLAGGADFEVIDGPAIDAMSAEELERTMGSARVFARITPAQKLKIIQAYQRRGAIVAMTGDGVNDGPALKAANIGVALGGRGTPSARELSDMVIEDDDLRTLAVALERGRTIRTNIRKSIRFLLSTNLSETMVVLMATSAGIGQPLSPIQLLWINLVSDVLPGLALSMEAPEPKALWQPPQDPTQPIIPGRELRDMAVEAAVIAGGSMGAYLWGLSRYGAGAQAGTMATTSLVVAQMLHALTCRSESCSIFARRDLAPNKALLWSLGGTFAVQLLAGILPPVRRLLGLAPVGAGGILVTAAAGVGPFLVNELIKAKRIAATERPPAA